MLKIENSGRMWRVTQNGRVVAFCGTYQLAADIQKTPSFLQRRQEAFNKRKTMN